MRRLLRSFALSLVSVLLLSCFGIDESGFTVLEPISFSEVGETIDVPLGESLVYDKLQVTSALPVQYQWAYGKRKNGAKTPWEMETMEVISTDPQINYIFPKIGSYVLRLRVDNSQSIEYKYFTLNVNSGLDEGLLVLSDAEGGESDLTFIKRRSASEIADGDREIWEDVFSTMNGGARITGGTSMFLSAYSTGGISYNHLLIGTDDSEGNVYDINPKDLSLIAATPMRTQFGTSCLDFSGKQTASTGSYTFMRGADGRVFRYDLFTPFITERTDLVATAGPVYRSKNIMYTTTQTYIKAAYWSDRLICQPDNNGTTTLRPMPDGWSIVAFASDRDANRTYILMREDANPKSYNIKYTTASLSALKDVTEFVSEDGVNMSGESLFCASMHSNDVYYSYKDCIWRWNLVSKPPVKPTFTLPQGEQICDIATNFMVTDDGTAETLLYVATWNPTREGARKGSIFIYEIATDTLYKSYEGICGKPVKILYKYRIS